MSYNSLILRQMRDNGMRKTKEIISYGNLLNIKYSMTANQITHISKL